MSLPSIPVSNESDLLEDSEIDELQYSEETMSEPDIDLENQYYQSKLMKEKSPTLALKSFRRVIELQEDQQSEWGFKALKQMIKLNFALGHFEDMLICYKELLHVHFTVTKMRSEKVVMGILDYSSTLPTALLQRFYEVTSEVCKDTQNDHLWFKAKCKLGKVYLAKQELEKVDQIVKELKESIDREDDNFHKSNDQLEICALEIQFYTELRNNNQLRRLYHKALTIQSAVPHPMVMSIIRECGGKMHLRTWDYDNAYRDFFEAFKNYDEAGSPKRICCLKYLFLTCMLMQSVINPVDSPEVKPFKDCFDIRIMTELLEAFLNDNIVTFQEIFKENIEIFTSDSFIQEHIPPLFQILRSKALVRLIQPYVRVKLGFLAKELDISEEDNEHLVINCILNGDIEGRIDDINQILVLEGKAGQKNSQNKYNAYEKIMNTIGILLVRLTNAMW